MTKKILQMNRRADKYGVTYIGQFAGCKVTAYADGKKRYRTVTKSGTFSIHGEPGVMHTICVDVDEYKKHYPDMDVLNLIKRMKKNCRLMEVEE